MRKICFSNYEIKEIFFKNIKIISDAREKNYN